MNNVVSISDSQFIALSNQNNSCILWARAPTQQIINNEGLDGLTEQLEENNFNNQIEIYGIIFEEIITLEKAPIINFFGGQSTLTMTDITFSQIEENSNNGMQLFEFSKESKGVLSKILIKNQIDFLYYFNIKEKAQVILNEFSLKTSNYYEFHVGQFLNISSQGVITMDKILITQTRKQIQDCLKLISGYDSTITLKNSQFIHLTMYGDNSTGLISMSNCNFVLKSSSFVALSVFNGVGSVGYLSQHNQFISTKNIFLMNSAVNQSKLVKNVSSGGVFYISQRTEEQFIYFKHNVFCNNGANQGGVVYANESNFIYFESNQFLQNYANEGAVFTFDQNNFEFKYYFHNDRFIKNYAKIGKISFLVESSKIFSYQVNVAQSGKISYVLSYGNEKGATIFDKFYEESNYQRYLSSYDQINIKTYELKFNNNEKNMTIHSQTGKFLENNACQATLGLADEFGNFIDYSTYQYYNYLSVMEVNDKINSSISFNISKIIHQSSEQNLTNLLSFKINSKGLVCLDKVTTKITGYVNSQHTYKFTYHNWIGYLTIIFDKCSLGDVNGYSQNYWTCETCTAGFYTLKQESHCTTCLGIAELNCTYGGHYIFPLKGYWRFDENSSNFMECPNGDACLGGYQAAYRSVQFYRGECAEGYQGPLCNSCTDEYGKVDENTCSQCASAIYYIWSVFQLILGLLTSIYSLYLGTDFVAFYFILFIFYIFQCIEICQPETPDLKKTIMENYIVKLFIYHIQSLQIVLLYPIEWKLGIEQIIAKLSFFSAEAGQAVTIDCVLKKSFWKNKSFVHFNVMCSVLLPFVILTVTLIIKFFRRKKQTKFELEPEEKPEEESKSQLVKNEDENSNKQNTQQVQNKDQIILEDKNEDNPEQNEKKYFNITYPMVAIQLTIILVLYSMEDILQSNFDVLACINVGDSDNEQYRLLNDLQVECSGEENNKWKYFLALPILFLIGIVFPIVICSVLQYYSSRGLTKSIQMKFQYGFIYYAFGQKFIFWELVIIARKMLMILITVLFAQEIKFLDVYPSIFLEGVIVLAAFLQVMFNPYDQERFGELNVYESTSLITQLLCYLIFSFKLTTYETLPDYVGFITVWLFLAFNVVFGYVFAKLYWKYKLLPQLLEYKAKAEWFLKKVNLKKENQEEDNKQPGEDQMQIEISEDKPLVLSKSNKNNKDNKNKIFNSKSDAIFSLKNKEIQFLQQKLKKNLQKTTPQQWMKQLPSENDEEPIDPNGTNKLIYFDVNEYNKISSSSILSKQSTVFENENIKIDKQNYFEGEYQKQFCACQQYTFCSKNNKSIKNLQIDFPESILTENGIVHSVFYESVQKDMKKWNYHIFYNFTSIYSIDVMQSLLTFSHNIIIDFGNDECEEIVNFPITYSLLDQCIFAKPENKISENKIEIQGKNNQLDTIKANLVNSQFDLENEQIFGKFSFYQFQDKIYNFEYTISLQNVSDINVNVKQSPYEEKNNFIQGIFQRIFEAFTDSFQ